MLFEQALQPATLIQRYKRFLADVVMPDGSEITVHTPNTGSMRGCSDAGSTVYLRDTQNPKRKYRWSWEMSTAANGALVGVSTALANALVDEAIAAGLVSDLACYGQRKAEVKYGENSRIDWLLTDGDKPACYVEVKNVTLTEGEVALFPDAVTTRGAKHLQELQSMVAQGARAAMVYCIQRGDVQSFRPADHIDPTYGELLREASKRGVEVYALAAEVQPTGVTLDRSVRVELS
ncbi:MAG: DNA/RNA nuclease SfsA [Granulosicoccaceae bacterium]